MLIYYNPHVDDFLAEPVQFRILKRRALKKYGFLIDQARAAGQPVHVLVDGTASGLIPESIFHKFPAPLRRLLSALEFKVWKKINGFGDEIRHVMPATAPSPDVLLAFSYKAATGNFALRQPLLARYRAVVFHLSHYFVSTQEKSANIRSLHNAFVAGDSDVREVPYFKAHFGWYERPFLVLPFAVAGRFVVKRPWHERDDRAVATGSFHDLRLERPACKYDDFMRTTGLTTYHPIRKAIHDAASSLTHWVDCRVSPYRRYSSNRLRGFTSHFRVSQKKYFSINIVDLYNSYKFAVVGEELSGFPALGAFEAMACGGVLFADPEYYRGLGLESDVHYIAYNGGVGELLAAIGDAKEDSSLGRMSSGASRYVRENFNSANVYRIWLDRLQEV